MQRRWLALAGLALAVMLGMSTWFSATAVIPQLTDEWGLTSTTKAWLTIAVQLGFVIGALVSGVLNVADRLPLRFVILGGAACSAIANLGLLAAGGAGQGIVLRFVTGFGMAFVYPPSFKLVSTWFREGRGMALGVIAGALITGNALPHLVNGLGGVAWETVIVATTILSAIGGIAVLPIGDGPYPFPTARFDPSQIGRVFRNRGVRLASIGYFGHMWELFAMYAWFLVFFSDHLTEVGSDPDGTAALVTFLVIAAGGISSAIAGIVADRIGRERTTIALLATSGACSIGIGLLFGGPTWLVVLVGLVWGAAVVADSAQFSAIVTERGDQSYVGTALTMQVAIGFTITVATIWLIPIVVDAVTWRWAFALLSLGPVVGIRAMARLQADPTV
jgi:MFS family permease